MFCDFYWLKQPSSKSHFEAPGKLPFTVVFLFLNLLYGLEVICHKKNNFNDLKSDKLQWLFIKLPMKIFVLHSKSFFLIFSVMHLLLIFSSICHLCEDIKKSSTFHEAPGENVWTKRHYFPFKLQTSTTSEIYFPQK